MWIPKPDGKQRLLECFAIKDRVAQTAAVKLVLEQQYSEADLQPEQYAYQRADGSALDAVRHVHKLLNNTAMGHANCRRRFKRLL